jgi:hypothetical protein
MNCDDKIISIYDTNFNAQGLTLPVGPISMRLNYNTGLHTIASAISGHNCKISIQKAIASMHIDPERESEFDRVEPHSFYKTCNNFKGTNNMQPNQSNNMVFATYGLQDWIVNKFHQDCFSNNINLIIEHVTWIVGARFDMKKLKLAFNQTRFMFTSRTSAVMICDDSGDECLVEVVVDGIKMQVQIHGRPDDVARIIQDLDTQYSRMESTIHWVYGSHGQTSEVPLNFKPAHNEFYPFLGSDLHTFFENYLDSDEAVLILIGPPGTGKTTFIKNLLHFGKGDALVTFDPNIMASDSLFARFIDEAEIDFLVMEDADAFLKSRTDGNQMMHKFLNVSDGLISTRGKKLIFSTNLPSINDIDDALLRPGRCFKVIEFRQLTRDEANKLNDVVPVNLTNDQEKFTLAELMSTRTAEQKAAVVKSTRTMGFY